MIKTIADIDESFQLVDLTQDVKRIDNDLGVDECEEHSYFIRAVDGEITDAYLFAGCTPYLDKRVVKII